VSRRAFAAACLVALAACARPEGGTGGSATDPSPHHAGTVTVNGARLAYLDWGGRGPGLLLLHGLGDSPHVFDDLAPALTDHFYVVGLARRAHGGSERRGPYDVGTLVEDIRQFLDSLGWRQAVLVGHSMAGSEMVRFAALYPERVSRLVFLDAAYDYDGDAFTTSLAHAPFAFDATPRESASFAAFRTFLKDGNWPGLPWSPAMEATVRDVALPRADGGVDYVLNDTVVAGAFLRGLRGYRKEYARVRAPSLAIVAGMYPGAVLAPGASDSAQRQAAAWIAMYARPFAEGSLARFRAELRGGRVIEMPESNHYVFLQRPAAVITALRDFLAETAPVRPPVLRQPARGAGRPRTP
jgi:pimeloyl-ACP methyl ester carboxylesterase